MSGATKANAGQSHRDVKLLAARIPNVGGDVPRVPERVFYATAAVSINLVRDRLNSDGARP